MNELEIKVYNALLKITKEKPILKIRISDLAKECETSIGSIYKLFTNKEDIINSAYVYFKSELRNSIHTENYSKSEIFANFIEYGFSNREIFDFIRSLDVRKYLTSETRENTTESLVAIYELLETEVVDKNDYYFLEIIITASLFEYVLETPEEKRKSIKAEQKFCDELSNLIESYTKKESIN